MVAFAVSVICRVTILLFLSYIPTSHKVIEQIENKNSALREENVEVKEQLNRALLEKDCLRQEQGETADALQKIELQNAELGMIDSIGHVNEYPTMHYFGILRHQVNDSMNVSD